MSPAVRVDLTQTNTATPGMQVIATYLITPRLSRRRRIMVALRALVSAFR